MRGRVSVWHQTGAPSRKSLRILSFREHTDEPSCETICYSETWRSLVSPVGGGRSAVTRTGLVHSRSRRAGGE
ncbi:hypothetical protein E2C01_050145 [Portunus trituberculatus]|uniref:Uncharacterized protein n=1 Tax=Portunus trituberculatus TaxID=210409 RepID=A0A5B7GBA1_PORTR|nr:hypothetical protein [Portunus trituberculatus]